MANEEKPSNEIITIKEESSNFPEQFSVFYSEQLFSDVDIKLDGHKIHCHKVILAARSEYFRLLLTKNPTDQSDVIITGVSITVFQKILEYIYTGSLTLKSSDIETIFEVIQLANKLSLKSLQMAISDKLLSFIEMENIFNIFNKASFYNDEEVKNVCLTFIDNNSSEILKSDDFNNLTQKSLITLLERDSFVEPEIEIFKSVANWCKVNKDENSLVLEKIRLNCLTNEEILTIVRPTKLVDDEKIFSVLTEIIHGLPETAKPRVTIYNDENICSKKFSPTFIHGKATDVLLGLGNSNFAYHDVGDENGITVEFRHLCYVNYVSMKLWEDKKTEYSYYIEVSQDQKMWEKVIDYSLYRCRSVQNVYFKKRIVKYIRIVGTFSTIENEFRIKFLNICLKSKIQKTLNGLICPEQNVITMKERTSVFAPNIVKGTVEYFLSNFINAYMCMPFDQECVVQLAQPYIISNINLSFDSNEYKFLIETSTNKCNWEKVVDFRHDCYHNDSGSFYFKARPVLFIRITGIGHKEYADIGYKNFAVYWRDG